MDCPMQRSSSTTRASLRTIAILALSLGLCPSSPGQEPQPDNQPDAQQPKRFELPASDDGVPGKGTIRRYGWFQNLWRTRRAKWHGDTQRDQGAVVFFGDSITQGWGPDMGGSFPGTKVANRGISGDTTRGMLLRIEGDVLAVNPSGVVMLMGTNDLEEGDRPEDIAHNVRAIVNRLVAHDRSMPIFLCKVFPSSARMRRPADAIQRINALCTEAVADVPQVQVLDTYSLFANADGDAKKAEFPDLLHPNKAGYAKWANVLRPALAATQHPNRVVWEGDAGPGKGKHIVFIAGDHEYRGEETLPALARILAKTLRLQVHVPRHHRPKDRLHPTRQQSHHRTSRHSKSADLMVRIPSASNALRMTRCSTSRTT